MTRNFTIENGTATPSFPGIMLAIVIALRELGGQRTNAEIAAKIIANEGITDPEKSYRMGSGKTTKLTYYLRWSHSYLKYNGILENPAHGVWALTDAGQEITVLAQTTSAHRAYLARRREQEQNEENHANEEEDPPVADEENATDDAAWKTILLETLLEIEPVAFEVLCGILLLEVDFFNVELLGGVADGGVDGVGFLHDNLLSRKIYFQCKRWIKPISSNQIRDFRGALHGRANKGLFITTSRFTAPAIQEATRDGALLIDLIDGDRLCDLLHENNLGFKTENGQKTLTPEWFNSFDTIPPNQ